MHEALLSWCILATCVCACGGATVDPAGVGREGTVTKIYDGQGGASRLVIHDGFLFLTISESENGRIIRIPRDGGAPLTLASSLRLPVSLTADSTHVFWHDPLAGSVLKAPVEGGPSVTLAGGQSSQGNLAVDATSVYWTQYDAGRIMKVSIEGGTLTTLSAGQLGPVDIAVDGANIYWTNLDGGSVMRASLDGSEIATLATGVPGPGAIALDETSVYWVCLENGTVMKTPKAGGAMITLASGQSRPVAVSVDATSAYWVNQGSWDDQAKEWRRDGTLSKVSRNGGGQLILASAQDVPVDVAGDSTSVYWLNSNSGSSGVLKLTPK